MKYLKKIDMNYDHLESSYSLDTMETGVLKSKIYGEIYLTIVIESGLLFIRLATKIIFPPSEKN